MRSTWTTTCETCGQPLEGGPHEGHDTGARAPAPALAATRLDRQPGNGTRYRLVVVDDPDGGHLVLWPDARWFGWRDAYTGQLRTRAGRIGKPDLEAIAQILAAGERGGGHG